MAENVDAVHRSEISAELGQCQRTSIWRGKLDRTTSRSFSRVALKQATESLMTANVGQAYGIRFLDDLVAFLRRGFFDQLIVQALMRSFEMIMIFERTLQLAGSSKLGRADRSLE